MSAAPVLRAEGLERRVGGLDVVRGISLAIEASEWVALLGHSGCGKTTLLSMLGLLDRPDAGDVLLDGKSAWRRSAGERAALRLEKIGFVFQQHGLLGHLSARENVALPAWRLSGSRGVALSRADELLARFGVDERRHARASVLSPGEQQRVAIARALVNRPSVVLADEPTGSLDSAAAAAVLAALDEVCRSGAALLVVTHDPDVAEHALRRLVMRDGRLS